MTLLPTRSRLPRALAAFVPASLAAAALVSGATGAPALGGAALGSPPPTAGGASEADADKTQAPQIPPGMVMVTAGEVRVGAPLDEILELAAAFPQLKRTLAMAHAGDDGKRLDHGPFYIQRFEVTNEQYAEFVKATGHRPPVTWAGSSVAEAMQAHTSEQGRIRQAAREAGEPVPEREPFNEFKWWSANWEGSDWQIPEGEEALPVTMVSYFDARDYATWAGLRLPTELEWEAAAGRGRDGSRYPWGDDWVEANAVTSNGKTRSDAATIGSLPEGAAMHGTEPVFDMSGNVWEWTASYLEPWPGFDKDDLVLKTGKRSTVQLVPRFDVDENVVKGGSFGNDEVAVRLWTRQGQQRDQQLELLGFRCAADLGVGQTFGANLDRSLPTRLRPGGSLAPQLALVRDRYVSAPGSVDVPGYAVIQSYDHVGFVPIDEIELSSGKDLSRASVKDGPVGLGVFATSVALLEPALEPGRYLVAYRGAGKPAKRKDEDQPEDGDAVGAIERSRGQDSESIDEPYDLGIPNLIFFNEAGDIVATQPVIEIEASKIERGVDPRGTLSLGTWVEPKRPKEEDIAADTLQLESWVPTKRKGYAFKTPMTIKLTPGTIDDTWR